LLIEKNKIKFSEQECDDSSEHIPFFFSADLILNSFFLFNVTPHKKNFFFQSFSIQSFCFLFFDEQISREETIDERREIDERETDRNDAVENK